jgi:WD40 repeat protein
LPNAFDDTTPRIAPRSISIARHGRWIAVLRGGVVQIYDIESRKLNYTSTYFRGDEWTPTSIAISPDGRNIAVAISGAENGHAIFVLRISDSSIVGKYESAPSEFPATALRWSPVGGTIAFITEGRKLHLWSPYAIEKGEAEVVLDGLEFLEFGPDGEKIAVGADRNVKVLSLR